MFDNCVAMVIRADKNEDFVYRLEMDATTQQELCISFSNAHDELLNEKTKVVFDGSYKPLTGEFLTIENFQLPPEIMDAIRDPIGVKSLQKENGIFPEIKAVFIGERIESDDSEKFNIAFQRFRKEQYISPKWFNLFLSENTFSQEKRYGISIADSIDCFYTANELQFVSFYFARQIFDLSGYYRSATDQEVASFVTNENLLIEDAASFKSMADTWIRRKIAMINDSRVLENYSASQIKSLASKVDIKIDVENRKIKLPNDKESIKVILGFLDEETYKGPFSKNTYLANSKRTIAKK
ncbi:Kiwa anti-phage protein KwaB-like domain-containing protein [Ruminococcus flavefaciens]|uniref:DUF4868 domain-containing protein n=1 Tax=Ruminococcus flavefaciens TaxID=1265 RepID=A0A1M7MGV9_RUMFL|nr:Kiwa anti-phage protein KwaB-like domain-containing protein [Ruminococcus flavefaciens]SHM90071.1 protein of unknown function [Ruminococcus flavefaciens]